MSCLRLALAAAGLFALTSCSRPQPDTLTTNRSSDGSVLQGADSKRIYLITAGKRHYIQTPQTLQALGVVNRVMSSPDSFLSSIPEGVPLPPLNSPLIQKASTGEVFLLEAGKRRYVPNPPTLASLPYTKDQVRGVPEEVADAIPLGDQLPSVTSN